MMEGWLLNGMITQMAVLKIGKEELSSVKG